MCGGRTSRDGSLASLCKLNWLKSLLGLMLQEKEPRLPTLLKLLLWAQNQLDNKLQYPRMVDLVAGRLSDPADVNQMC